MKKRPKSKVLSIVLSLALVVGLCPGPAWGGSLEGAAVSSQSAGSSDSGQVGTLVWSLSDDTLRFWLDTFTSGERGSVSGTLWDDETRERLREQVTSIVIGDGIDTIGDFTFKDWKNLQKVSLPDSMTRIGWSAFEGCESLGGVRIPKNVGTIENGVFRNCTSLGAVAIAGPVTTIVSQAFYGCTELEELNFLYENELAAIGSEAFYNCGKLKRIDLPYDLKRIGRGAFDGCGSMTSVEVSQNVEAVGDYAFARCNALEHAYLYCGDAELGENVFAKSGFDPAALTIHGYDDSPVRAYAERYGIAFASLGSIAAEGVYGMTSGELDDGGTLTIVGKGAVTSYFGPSRTRWLGSDRYDYRKVKRIVISEGVTEVGDGCFCELPNLTDVEFPDTLTEIGGSAFLLCTSLKRVELPADLTLPIEIGDYAFWGCTSLAELELHDVVRRIGRRAFWECTSLVDVTFTTCYRSDTGTNMVFNESLTLDEMAFADCSSLKNITFDGPGSLYVDPGAFSGCDALADIYRWMWREAGYLIDCTMPFIGANEIATVHFMVTCGEGVVGEFTFIDPSRVSQRDGDEIRGVISGTGTYEGVWPSGWSTLNLVELTIEEGITGIGTAVINDTVKRLTVPGSVTEVDQLTKWNSTPALESVTLQPGVQAIGESAFSGCSNLTEVTLPGSVSSIGPWAFDGCTSLESIVIPDGTSSIGQEAFANCPNLVSVTIPKSVTSISEDSPYFDEGDPENMRLYPVFGESPSLTICGYGDSLAQDYAQTHLFPFVALDAPVIDLPAEGTWGTCSWRIDPEGCLTIRPGIGADSGGVPWSAYGSAVRSVVVAAEDGEGVTAPEDSSYLFAGLPFAETFELSGLDTSHVRDMAHMFDGCFSLTSLDLSGFDTSNVGDMRGMFARCGRLETIYASGLWSMGGFADDGFVERTKGMFALCWSLVGGGGSECRLFGLDYAHAWAASDYPTADGEYARIDSPGAPDYEPGFFTAKNAPRKRSISDALIEIVGSGSFEYDGKPHEVQVRVSLDEGATVLERDADYTLTFEDNVNVGTATAKVEGIGDYAGEGTVAFAIAPKVVTVPKAKAKLVYAGKKLTGVAAGAGFAVTGGTAVAAGTHTATATLKNARNYVWADGTTAAKRVKFTIAKAANPLNIAGKAASVKYSKKKAATVKASKAYNLKKKAVGTVSYTRVKKGSSKYLSGVNSKTGDITVKAGTPKGKTYTVNVKVSAKGNANYKSAAKTIAVKVKVR